MTQQEHLDINNRYTKKTQEMKAVDIELETLCKQFMELRKTCTHYYPNGKVAIHRGFEIDTCNICGDVF